MCVCVCIYVITHFVNVTVNCWVIGPSSKHQGCNPRRKLDSISMQMGRMKIKLGQMTSSKTTAAWQYFILQSDLATAI